MMDKRKRTPQEEELSILRAALLNISRLTAEDARQPHCAAYELAVDALKAKPK